MVVPITHFNIIICIRRRGRHPHRNGPDVRQHAVPITGSERATLVAREALFRDDVRVAVRFDCRVALR